MRSVRTGEQRQRLAGGGERSRRPPVQDHCRGARGCLSAAHRRRDDEIDGAASVVGCHLDACGGEAPPPVVEFAEHHRAPNRSGENEPWVDPIEAQCVSSA